MKKRQTFSVKVAPKKRNKVGPSPFDREAIEREVADIVEAALQGQTRVVSLGPLVFFSNGDGEAWVIEVNGNAAPLCRGFEPLELEVRDTPTGGFAIGWPNRYSFEGAAFVVSSREGNRTALIFNYPVRQIEETLARARALLGGAQG